MAGNRGFTFTSKGNKYEVIVQSRVIYFKTDKTSELRLPHQRVIDARFKNHPIIDSYALSLILIKETVEI